MSGLLEALEQYSYSSTDQPLCTYGDLAHPMRVHLPVLHRGARLSNDEQSFNTSMGTVRTALEWVFGDITSYFAFFDFKKNLKIGPSPVCKMSVPSWQMQSRAFMAPLQVDTLMFNHPLFRNSFRFEGLLNLF